LTGCVYFIDNDILRKLAIFNLFDETLKLLNASREQARILATARYKFERDWEKLKNKRAKNDQDKFINYEKTIELIETLSQMSVETVYQDLFLRLSEFEGIDQGEAILISHVIKALQEDRSAQVFMLTGDKRFLKALVKVEMPMIQIGLVHRF